MQTKITITNSSQTCFIDIEGTIGVEHNEGGSTSSVATYEAFRREVERIAEVAAQRVVVNIRSTGGDVNDALLIYDALRALDAHVTTRCYGYTASAATIIAQAADEGAREISGNAMYLIHRSMCAIEGNAQSLQARAELLQKTDERLAQLYALHSKRSVEEYVALMAENNGEGRWLTAEETVAAGLADCITDPLITGVLVPEKEDTPSDVDIPQVENSAAGEIIRYLLGRLAYRIEEWLERLHEKHMEKREAKRAEKEATQEQETLPQAAAQSPTKSIVTFEEGQRRYSSSKVKPAEDPSMNQPLLRANEEAYAADAKAFGKY